MAYDSVKVYNKEVSVVREQGKRVTWCDKGRGIQERAKKRAGVVYASAAGTLSALKNTRCKAKFESGPGCKVDPQRRLHKKRMG